MLLGENRKGGVYEGSYVVPGGGVDDGETKEQALAREMLEETGIDISFGEIDKINVSTGQAEKTLRDTGERVLVEMVFHDYRVKLSEDADDVIVKAEDDWCSPRWFAAEELVGEKIGPPTKRTLQKIGFLANKLSPLT